MLLHKSKIIIPFTVAIILLFITSSAQANIEDDLHDLMENTNISLQQQDLGLQLNQIEYFTANEQQGRTVYFNHVGNKQLAIDFIPNDPRRALWSGSGSGDDITWASDSSMADGKAGGPVSMIQTQMAISGAMGTWQNANCSNLPLNHNATGPMNIGILEFIFFGTSVPIVAADIVHAGFGTPLDMFLPSPIIAATFTFVFVSGDLDDNGLPDVAFREIYYTNNFIWGVNSNVDIETVALHEAGHALSQAHFGKLHKTDNNGKFHFSPRAVMNAGYTGVQQQLAGTDNAGHCSLWGNWPNN